MGGAQMTVRIRVPDAQAGYHAPPQVRTVTIAARCPTCGGQRGAPERRQRTRAGVTYEVDEWTNACGHIDFYSTVLDEELPSKNRLTCGRTVDGFLIGQHTCVLARGHDDEDCQGADGTRWEGHL